MTLLRHEYPDPGRPDVGGPEQEPAVSSQVWREPCSAAFRLLGVRCLPPRLNALLHRSSAEMNRFTIQAAQMDVEDDKRRLVEKRGEAVGAAMDLSTVVQTGSRQHGQQLLETSRRVSAASPEHR